MGQTLGKELLFEYIDRFGFGEKTGIDLNGESTGIIFTPEQVGNVELATSAFGQGISVTPIQQVNAVSSVVNGGILYRPFMVKNILEKETGNVIFSRKKQKIRRTISKETSETMRSALESVVAVGGGRSAYIDGYRIGGKTGTAQKAVDGKYLVNNYIMSFISIVPSNNPRAVLYIAIDNPKNSALLSSYTTTPIARRILLDVIEALDIPRQDGGMEKDWEWNDRVYHIIPNVIGMSVTDAKNALSNFSVEFTGTGEIVKEQSPTAGIRIEEGGIVRLLLE